jgi:hypothetical protein
MHRNSVFCNKIHESIWWVDIKVDLQDVVKLFTGFFWLRIWTTGGAFKDGNEPSVFL